MFRIFRFSIIILFVFTSFALSQSAIDQRVIDAEFAHAVEMYDAKRYNSALFRFEKIITGYDLNSKTSAANFFKIKILIENEEYGDANYFCSQFIETFPNSKYTDEVRVLLIKTLLEESDYQAAFDETLILIDQTNSILYRIEAKYFGEKIANKYLDSDDLQNLLNYFTSEKVKPYLLLLLGKSLLKDREIDQALTTFSQILQDYVLSEEYPEAKVLYDNPVVPEAYKELTSIIGILLPLNTDDAGNYTSSAASEILDGIKFAISEFNEDREDKIGVVIRDTKNDVDIIDDIRYELGNNVSIKALLGPIFSNEVRVALNSFDGTNLAILSPTATDNDLIYVSEDFFQANPPLAVRGKIMAQYIFYVENLRQMAVLNSIDGYSPLLAATFVDEFERLGGTIMAKETYKSNSFSVSEPISQIAIADTTDTLNTLEAIYIPLADKVDATVILSQLGKDSLYYPIYGNQDWFSAKGFESAPEISNMLTFSSDYYLDFNDDDYKIFSEKFSQLTGKDPNRNVLYGYDTAKYLLTVMRNIAPRRSGIKDKMISGIMSKGFHNNISFDENRINRFMNIVRYNNGIFELVEKFRYSN
jgi:branched-chain amino acid transport system substrate-binding protein